MKILKNYWKVLIALLLLAAAAFVYMTYQEELIEHESEIKRLNTANLSLQAKIKNNM